MTEETKTAETAETPETPEVEAVEEVEEEAPGIEPGMVCTAKVTEMGDERVLVDLDHGAKGFFMRREARAVDGGDMVSVGEEVEVLVDDLEGELWAVSMERAEKIRVFDRLVALAKDRAVVKGVVTRRVRQGLSVDIGVRALLPTRESGMRNHELAEAVGTVVECQILKFDRKKGEVTLSRKSLAQAQAKARKEEVFGKLNIGDRVTGVVSSLTKFGAFIDIGGADGLLHVSEMGWDRVARPSDLFAVGDEVEAEIVELNPERDRIGLSRKNLLGNPWEDFAKNHPEGSRAKGVVRSLTDFGAFVTIDGMDGLVHLSEMTWDRGVRNPGDLLSLEQEVEVIVLRIEPERQRVGLSIKRLQPNPWETALESINVGDRIKGKLSSVAKFGVFVEIVPGVEGLVHVSDMSWTKRIEKPEDLREFAEGDEVEVMVLEMNPDRQRISLGIKHLEADPWEAAGPELRPGGTLTVTVSRIAAFGAFATITPGLEGLIHVSELAVDRVDRIEDVVKVGDEVKAQVLSAERGKNKVSLSIKAHLIADGSAMREYTDEGSANNAFAQQLLAKGLVNKEDAVAEESAPAEEVIAAPAEVVEEAPVEATAEVVETVVEAAEEVAPAVESVEGDASGDAEETAKPTPEG